MPEPPSSSLPALPLALTRIRKHQHLHLKPLSTLAGSATHFPRAFKIAALHQNTDLQIFQDHLPLTPNTERHCEHQHLSSQPLNTPAHSALHLPRAFDHVPLTPNTERHSQVPQFLSQSLSTPARGAQDLPHGFRRISLDPPSLKAFASSISLSPCGIPARCTRPDPVVDPDGVEVSECTSLTHLASPSASLSTPQHATSTTTLHDQHIPSATSTPPSTALAFPFAVRITPTPFALPSFRVSPAPVQPAYKTAFARGQPLGAARHQHQHHQSRPPRPSLFTSNHHHRPKRSTLGSGAAPAPAPAVPPARVQPAYKRAVPRSVSARLSSLLTTTTVPSGQPLGAARHQHQHQQSRPPVSNPRIKGRFRAVNPWERRDTSTSTTTTTTTTTTMSATSATSLFVTAVGLALIVASVCRLLPIPRSARRLGLVGVAAAARPALLAVAAAARLALLAVAVVAAPVVAVLLVVDYLLLAPPFSAREWCEYYRYAFGLRVLHLRAPPSLQQINLLPPLGRIAALAGFPSPFAREGGGLLYVLALSDDWDLGDWLDPHGMSTRQFLNKLRVKIGVALNVANRKVHYRKCDLRQTHFWVWSFPVRNRLVAERLCQTVLDVEDNSRAEFDCLSPRCSTTHQEFWWLEKFGGFQNIRERIRVGLTLLGERVEQNDLEQAWLASY
ncbi:hypothetical protein C8F04DRAFT_1268076 [Mycena alexandri]|uniref:Uncharacterized protein n=1 Tax=Mycena alexandri TaxID=1745969 RepID=A0AAD6WWZ1_9AGAR|nr:hypothetical protein C8F04DRAFT_1268076 [Mycena alexandri]